VPQTGNGLAVTALVLGIIGIVVSWIPFVSWIVGALAIIFGAVGMSTANKRGGIGKGMAVAGLVLGVITIAIGVVFWIWIFTTAHTICSTYGNC
jgi:lysylphosphatidylglycerol synthetase-like protein (DUF2156 family)